MEAEEDAEEEAPTAEEADAKALGGKPALREAMLRAVRRLHVGLGHASGPDLVRILRNGGASEEAVKMARTLRCPTCEAHKRPGGRFMVALDVEGTLTPEAWLALQASRGKPGQNPWRYVANFHDIL